jgi:hypothetical protein
MPWGEWVDLDTIKVCVRHATGTIGAVLVFLAVRVVIHFGIEKGTLQTILEAVDSFVLVGLFVWLAYQMFVILWNRRTRIETPLSVLAL